MEGARFPGWRFWRAVSALQDYMVSRYLRAAVQLTAGVPQQLLHSAVLATCQHA